MRTVADLRPYQRDAAKFLFTHKQALLLADCGTGKTAAALSVIGGIIALANGARVLVVGPLNVVRDVWEVEAARWDFAAELTFARVWGVATQRSKALRSTADIYLCNYDNLTWLLEQDVTFDLVVFDEVSALKSTTTKRFKQLRRSLERLPRRWGLTATPCSNALEDIFGVAFAVAGAAPFGKSFPKWREAYFEQTDYMGYTWAPRADTEQRIYDALAPFTFRVARDALALPPVVAIERQVTLPGIAMHAYRELEKELFAELDSGTLTAANAAVATFKLQQILSGAVYDEHRRVLPVHDARVEACVELVDELQGERVVIAYWFKHEFERLKRAFPGALQLEFGHLWSRGEGQVLLVQIRSGAYGLDWLKTSCCRLIWFTQTWSLELHDQLLGRLARDGQESPTVWAWYLTTPDTVDSVCALGRGLKGTRQAALLTALADYRARG